MARWTMAAALAALGLVFAAQARAGTVASSTFDSGDDGWVSGDLATNTSYGAPDYHTSGGPAGLGDAYISTTDTVFTGALQSLWAPSKFLGNQSAAEGGSLTFDLIESNYGNYTQPLILISNGSLTLQYRSTGPVGANNWTALTVPLSVNANWQHIDLGSPGQSGSAATSAELNSVLANLTFLKIDTDWADNADTVGLDNVVLTAPDSQRPPAVPLPSALGAGLVGLSGLLGKRVLRRA